MNKRTALVAQHDADVLAWAKDPKLQENLTEDGEAAKSDTKVRRWIYCIHCGRARGDYNSCKCMPEISQRNRAVVPAPPPPPESVPCTCRLSWGGGCRALVEVPAAASAGRRSRALCQICTHHIGSETCGCRCGRCYRHDMNYQADSDECDAIEADATRRELYGWIDNVDDCMQEGLWQADRQRASDPASSMEARCPQTTDGKHRLYFCMQLKPPSTRLDSDEYSQKSAFSGQRFFFAWQARQFLRTRTPGAINPDVSQIPFFPGTLPLIPPTACSCSKDLERRARSLERRSR